MTNINIGGKPLDECTKAELEEIERRIQEAKEIFKPERRFTLSICNKVCEEISISRNIQYFTRPRAELEALTRVGERYLPSDGERCWAFDSICRTWVIDYYQHSAYCIYKVIVGAFLPFGASEEERKERGDQLSALVDKVNAIRKARE